jgi:hypothetical protein
MTGQQRSFPGIDRKSKSTRLKDIYLVEGGVWEHPGLWDEMPSALPESEEMPIDVAQAIRYWDDPDFWEYRLLGVGESPNDDLIPDTCEAPDCVPLAMFLGSRKYRPNRMDTIDEMLDRPLPADKEIERSLLNVIIRDNAAYDDVKDRLKEEHFFVYAARHVYGAIVALRERGEAATAESIVEEMSKEKSPWLEHEIQYIPLVLRAGSDRGKVGEYMNTMLRDYVTRKAIIFGNSAMRLGLAPGADGGGVILTLQQGLQDLAEEARRLGVLSGSSLPFYGDVTGDLDDPYGDA